MTLFTDLYPERRGGKINPSVWQRAISGSGHPDSLKVACERSVVWNLENQPMVRHMLAALNSAGCPVDLTRHVSCEMCRPGSEVENAGGCDLALNQVFICANNSTNEGFVHGALVRNLIQMFDICVNKYDVNNPDHLACTEVRKANLANCGFMVKMQRKDSDMKVKEQHRHCVKNAAIESLVRTKFVKEEVAKESVNRVFSRCYADLEPIGRRAMNKHDIERAFNEKFLFGYH